MDFRNENVDMSHGSRRRRRRTPRPNQPPLPTRLIDNTVSVDAPQDQALSQHLLRQNQELKLQLEREQQRNQASQEELLTQIENLKLDMRATVMEQEAKEAVEDEIRDLSERNARLETILDRKDKRAQRLLDAISETSQQKAALRNQITALQQELQQEQQEKESLRSQVTQLQSDLSERDRATVTAQRNVEQLQTETQKLSTTLDSLMSALNQEKSLTSEAEHKLQEKERETNE
uniref:Uncharacterized protein n=1 Tax=Knipowitschia caucasica TaxID=637954 RepID=A0AAV2J742_KNICA